MAEESNWTKYGVPILGSLAGEYLSRTSGGEAAATSAAGLQKSAITKGAGIQSEAFDRILPMLQEQLGLTRRSFDPFIEAGVGALPQLRQGYQAPTGTTMGGMEDVLSQIMGGGAYQGLVEERQRGAQGQLAAGGLTRSGAALETAAAIPTDIAMELENLLYGRQAGAEKQRISGLETLTEGGRLATGSELGESGDILSDIIKSITEQARIQSGGVTGAAQAEASGVLGRQQSKSSKTLNTIKTIGTIASLFSDPRLKKNIKTIGKVGPLNLVEWDWKDEFKDTIVSDCPTIGYLSTQVKEFYPEHVHEFGGYDVIDYKSVNEKASCH